MDDELRFYIERRGKVTGPVTDDDVRDALRDGKLAESVCVRLAGSELWASPRAFVALARAPGAGTPTMPHAPPPEAVAAELPRALAVAPQGLRDRLLFWLHEGDLVFGPLSGEQLRLGAEADQYRDAAAMLVDGNAWYRALLVAPPREPSAAAEPYTRDSSLSEDGEGSAPPSVEGSVSRPGARDPMLPPARAPARALYPSSGSPSAPGVSRSVSSATTRCPVCLERIAVGLASCPECGEATVSMPPSGSMPSIPDDLPGQSALAMHWRPIVTIGAIATLVCTGIALRHLAPGRFAPPVRAASSSSAPSRAAPPVTACSASCWNGEACQAGRCVWQPPNDVGHVVLEPQPTVSGPTQLPRDVSDAIPLDSERFAVALLTGIQIHNARTGNVLGLVTDAPQARRLYRVGPVIYATAPQRIFVIDAETTRIRKTIETGAPVGEVTVGASGRRALASLPGAHAIAVLATEYHAEIDRIQFGDDPVGPMGADDTGKRALTTTGQVPVPGFPQPQGGAVYAFDPSRLASAQDRVRASMVGNPVSVLMTPDGETSYVVLRAEDALVPLTWLPSGAVRQEARIPTCHEPEQIELVRRGRLGVVRCNEGRAIEVFDLVKRELLRHVPFNARVADLAIAPDGRQAIVALPAEGTGFVGLVDLDTWDVKMLPLGAEPTRVRLSPDGAMALVLSDRSKVAWVIR
jgi:hypothetical protein